MIDAISQNRWWIYQRERFPLFAHGMLITVFSLAAVTYSALSEGRQAFNPAVWSVAFVSTFGFFLLLRIADEFKDFEDDCRYRPYRPVPRGLILLKELRCLAIGVLLLQLILALALHAALTVLLVGVWAYLALMTVEFFRRDWLRKKPIPYMLSHMVIMPLIQLYASACEAMPHGSIPLGDISWFLAASYANGLIIEMGRKIRAPCDEEVGVETYSALWGAKRAIAALLGAMALAGILASLAAAKIGFFAITAVVMILLWIVVSVFGLRFLSATTTANAKAIEGLSGIWTLVSYLILGPVPMFLG